jgi:hypothetical protein
METVYATAEPADQVRWAGRVAGACWTAATVAVTFAALRTIASWTTALVLALLAGFASPLWSWASRSDTIEAPSTLVVAVMLWLAVRGTRGSARATALLALASGALATILWFLDPALGVATPVAILCVRPWPWTRPAALVAGAGMGAALLVGWGLATAGGMSLLPHLQAFDAAVFAAYLVSPGRGLVLFAPVAGFSVAALSRADEPRRLVRGSGLAVLVALAHVACLDDPWGPQAFGPALLSPVVPLLAVMAAGLPAVGVRWGSLVLIPVVLAHAAVVLDGGYRWDRRREPLAHPDAVWDLRDSPFRDLVQGPPTPNPAFFLPSAFAMAPGDHPTRAGDDVPWLAFGWESPEAAGTWASGRESWIVLAVPPGDYTLTLTAAAPLIHEHGQRLEIERPGGPPMEVAFAGGLWSFQPVTISFQPQAGITVLKIRPAETWRPGRGDVRRLGLFVASLRLEHSPALTGQGRATSARWRGRAAS